MSSQCPYCNQIVPYGADVNMPINHDNTLGKALLDTFGGKEKTYTESDLQKKLRQQREACLEAYSAKYLELFDRLPADNDYLSRGILNATIDNNGEEG